METLQKDRLALIALGANQLSQFGGVETTLRRSLGAFDRESVRIRTISRFFRTPAFPAGSGPDYINAAALAETCLEPAELLAELHRIEVLAGRIREHRWGPRVLDLDLIGYGNRLFPDQATLRHWIDLPLDEQARIAPEHLILPHPRMQDRAFVLVPLADIAPGWRHPLTGASVREMLARLPAEARAEVRPL